MNRIWKIFASQKRKRTNQTKKNTKMPNHNQGSTMILVLVCMFVISLIGAMVLSATMINYRMKLTQSQSNNSFYDTESITEELTEALSQKILNAYQLSYDKLLRNWLDESVQADRQKYFLLDLADNLGLMLRPELSDPTAAGEVTKYIADGIGTLDTCFFELNAKLTEVGTIDFPAVDSLTLDIRKQELCFHKVSLQLKNDSGFETKLQTNLILRLSLPMDSLASESVAKNSNIDDFVIISSGTITSDSSATGGAGETKAYVNGSLYAGGDFLVHAGLSVDGHHIVVGDRLLVPYGSALSMTGEGIDTDGLWVRNIEMSGGSLDLATNCFVLDDTTFSTAKGSKMSIRDGGYYGYSYHDAPEADPSLSSAIIINQPNVLLDLSAADPLWLAGNAYIKEAKLFDSASGAADDGILIGESLAYKGMQPVYLFPGSCIAGVSHNPILMTESFQKNKGEILENDYRISEVGKQSLEAIVLEFPLTIGTMTYPIGTHLPAGTAFPVGTVLPAGMALPFDVRTPIIEMVLNRKEDGSFFEEDGYYLDLSDTVAKTGVDLTRYIDANQPVTVRYSNTMQQSYFYMKFKSPEKASDYLKALFASEKGEDFLDRLLLLDKASILLPPPESQKTVGNLVEYDYDPLADLATYQIQKIEAVGSFRQTEARLTSRYNSLLTGLSLGGGLGLDANPKRPEELHLFQSLIHQGNFFMEEEGNRSGVAGEKLLVDHTMDVNGNPLQYCIYACEEEDTILLSQVKSLLSSYDMTNLLLITNGNVCVDEKYAGTIIAKGNVTVQLSGLENTITTGPSGLREWKQHDFLGKYFSGSADSETDLMNQSMGFSDLIKPRYDNWVKN